jgi:hypothetical protein
MVPTIAFPPGASSTLHVTSVEAPFVPVTLAVNTCAPPVATLSLAGEIITTMSGGGGGGGGDLGPTAPAHADSIIVQTQMTTRQAKGAQLCATRRAA